MDGISNEMCKYGGEKLLDMLINLLNDVWREEWQKAIMKVEWYTIYRSQEKERAAVSA